MQQNLDELHGLIMSERIMMKFAEKLGRQTAHDILHEDAMRAFESNISFVKILKEDRRISQAFSGKEIDGLMNCSTYVGLAPKYVDRIFNEEHKKISNEE